MWRKLSAYFLFSNFGCHQKKILFIQISKVMDKFEEQFENLDLNSKYMENTIDSTTSQTMPEKDVNGLMAQIADEHGLEFQSEMENLGTIKKKEQNKQQEKNEDNDLESRLKRLQGI